MSIDLAAIAKQSGVKRKTVELRPIEPSVAARRDYERVLRAMLAQIAKYTREELIPLYRIEESPLTLDASGDRISAGLAGLDALILRLTGTASAMARRIFEAEANRHSSRFAASVRAAIGIDLSAVIGTTAGLNNVLSLTSLRSAEQIKGMADDARKRIAEVLTRNLTQGASIATVRKDLSEQFGFEAKRAQLIARNETENFNAALNEFRQISAGVELYRYTTSQDERVRDSHDAMDGKICRWDDPTVYLDETTGKWEPRSAIGGSENHPGTEINCRCVSIAIIEID